MQVTLRIRFFESVLGGTKVPAINPNKPYQAGLIVEGFDDPIGVELLEVLDELDGSLRCLSKPMNPEILASSLKAGTEFFVTRGGKMLGRGHIEQAVT